MTTPARSDGGRRVAGPLGPPPRGRLDIAALACALLGLCACREPATINLVAVRGCGLEQEFSGLRVRVVGDLPSGAGRELLLAPGERGTVDELPPGATGVVAEGLFGTTVTAVGRSFGRDTSIARRRVPGVGEGAALPIYFSVPDGLCELPTSVGPRRQLAGAAGPAGDLLLVGGRDSDGRALAEIVHVDVLAGAAPRVLAELDAGLIGASVHVLGGREFVVVGGVELPAAGPARLRSELLRVAVAGSDPLVELGPLVVDGEPRAVAHHASAAADGRALLAGGCTAVDAVGACEVATAHSLWLALDGETVAAEAGPPLTRARHGAHAHLTADGVAFVAGGRDDTGLAARELERLLPGGGWERVHSLDASAGAIVGMTVLDGGLVLLSDADGLIHWWSPAGSGTLDPTLRAPLLGPAAESRPLTTLPGERVLADNWLFAPGSAAVDPAAERVELAGPARSGALSVPLLDGTFLLAGGREGADAALVDPWLARLRPELDGPDEWIPDLGPPRTDAFVANAPGRATVVVGGLRLEGVGGASDAPPQVQAHVRGFRSGGFRLEFSFEHEPEAAPAVVLGQGSARAVFLSLAPTLRVWQRDAALGLRELDCGHGEAQPDEALVLEVGDQGRQLRLAQSGVDLLVCTLSEPEPWPAAGGPFVGFAVAGSGSARFFALRLARRE